MLRPRLVLAGCIGAGACGSRSMLDTDVAGGPEVGARAVQDAAVAPRDGAAAVDTSHQPPDAALPPGDATETVDASPEASTCTGGGYWAAIDSAKAPSARGVHGAAWTGS